MDFMKEALNIPAIINGLIVAIIFEILRNNIRIFPALTKITHNPRKEEIREISRTERNREILSNIIFYFFTYMMVYFAILLPAATKAHFVDYTVLLSHARTIGDYLPNIAITKDHFQWEVMVLSTGIYLFLFFIVNLITIYLFTPALRIFYEKVHAKTQYKFNGGMLTISSLVIVAFGFSEFFDVKFELALFAAAFLILAIIGEATTNNSKESLTKA